MRSGLCLNAKVRSVAKVLGACAVAAMMLVGIIGCAAAPTIADPLGEDYERCKEAVLEYGIEDGKLLALQSTHATLEDEAGSWMYLVGSRERESSYTVFVSSAGTTVTLYGDYKVDDEEWNAVPSVPLPIDCAQAYRTALEACSATDAPYVRTALIVSDGENEPAWMFEFYRADAAEDAEDSSQEGAADNADLVGGSAADDGMALVERVSVNALSGEVVAEGDASDDADEAPADDAADAPTPAVDAEA